MTRAGAIGLAPASLAPALPMFHTAHTAAALRFGAALMASQARIDAEARRTLAGEPPPPDPAQADDRLVARMAETMALRRAAFGACDEKHLAAAGFTASQIARLADQARALAARREDEQ